MLKQFAHELKALTRIHSNKLQGKQAKLCRQIFGNPNLALALTQELVSGLKQKCSTRHHKSMRAGMTGAYMA